MKQGERRRSLAFQAQRGRVVVVSERALDALQMLICRERPVAIRDCCVLRQGILPSWQQHCRSSCALPRNVVVAKYVNVGAVLRLLNFEFAITSQVDKDYCQT